MNKFVFLLILLSCSFFSCGSDESCTIETVVGTYTGTSACDDPDAEGPTSLTVMASGDNLVLTDQDGFDYELPFRGCNNSIPSTTIDLFGTEVSYSGNIEFSEGALDLEISVDAGFFGSATCTFQGSK